MKINYKKSVIGLFAIALAACSSEVIEKTLPDGNLNLSSNKVNTVDDDLAPFIRPVESAGNLQLRDKIAPTDGNLLLQSDKFLSVYIDSNFAAEYRNKLMPLTSDKECVSFINSNSGFVSFSHAFSDDYAKEIKRKAKILYGVEINFSGHRGGTDIFYFEKQDKNYNFTCLDSAVNSPFWDSHPFVGGDPAGNLLLVWASDRNSPFNLAIDTGNTVVKQGNIDLFYSFKSVNGTWSPAKALDLAGINTTSDEISPYITCMDILPRLLFASNREKGGLDIYSVPLDIDFKRQTVAAIMSGMAEKLPSPINSGDDEKYPYFAMDEKGSSMLYLSSNRFAPENPDNKKNPKSGVGGYDMYKFDFPYACNPPRITLRVDIVSTDGQAVRNPVIKLLSAENKIVLPVSGSGTTSCTFELEPETEYRVWGGSTFNETGCPPDVSRFLTRYHATADNSFVCNSADALTKSNRSLAGTIKVGAVRSDVILYDTISLSPEYFDKPQCTKVIDTTWASAGHLRNVPYFQTAFWEVNTSRGLEESIRRLRTDDLQKCNWIEMHRGYRSTTLAQTPSYEDRKEKYRKYAAVVDTNLQKIADEIISECTEMELMNTRNASAGKLVVEINAWSDKRDASACSYPGNSLSFLEYDPMIGSGNILGMLPVTISKGASLGKRNEILSKLRAFYGYKAILSVLKSKKDFREKYIDTKLVFDPTAAEYKTEADWQKGLERSQVIFVIRGRNSDERVEITNPDEFDPVRRIDLIMQHIYYNEGKIKDCECCVKN